MLAETQVPVPYQGLGGQYINGSWPARRAGCLGSHMLHMATLRAATVVVACAAAVMRATSAPSVQPPATASSITQTEQEAARLDQLPAMPPPHTADHSGPKQ